MDALGARPSGAVGAKGLAAGRSDPNDRRARGRDDLPIPRSDSGTCPMARRFTIHRRRPQGDLDVGPRGPPSAYASRRSANSPLKAAKRFRSDAARSRQTVSIALALSCRSRSMMRLPERVREYSRWRASRLPIATRISPRSRSWRRIFEIAAELHSRRRANIEGMKCSLEISSMTRHCASVSPTERASCSRRNTKTSESLCRDSIALEIVFDGLVLFSIVVY